MCAGVIAELSLAKRNLSVNRRSFDHNCTGDTTHLHVKLQNTTNKFTFMSTMFHHDFNYLTPDFYKLGLLEIATCIIRIS